VSLRGTFDSVADSYDAARPAYPVELYNDLIALAALAPWARLLEVGCGTGKATRPLAERGFRVTCVELGADLARVARSNLAGLPVDVHVAPFETWKGPAGAFDLVYSATAWHWIEPEARYRRAHELLRPRGHLAIWSAVHAFPVDVDPFFVEIQATYDAIGEPHDGSWPPPRPEEVPDGSAEIEASGLFEDVRTRRYLWALEYTADEYLALLDTFSGHIAMRASAREHLYREARTLIEASPGRRIRRHWLAILHVARARP
jgi:SAM-dependent methyltransferase